jgi:hypothetical protein
MNYSKSAGFVLLGLVAAAPVALAQPRGGGRGGMPPTPVGTALDKVPVGTWAEYDVKRGDEPARKVRHALVSKGGGSFVLETRTATPAGDKIISQATVGSDPTAEGGVKKLVTQFGAADPMEMPVRPMGERGPDQKGDGKGGPPPGGPGGGEGNGPGRGMMMGRMGGARFLKPDPKAMVGKETLKLGAGTFAAEHYKQAGPRGGTVEYWLAKDAGPLGVVKVAFERPAGDEGQGDKVTMELVGKGKGATPEITKPAKPFDPEAMRARFGRGPGGPGGAPAAQ